MVTIFFRSMLRYNIRNLERLGILRICRNKHLPSPISSGYLFFEKYFFMSSSDLPLVSGAMKTTKRVPTRQTPENMK